MLTHDLDLHDIGAGVVAVQSRVPIEVESIDETQIQPHGSRRHVEPLARAGSRSAQTVAHEKGLVERWRELGEVVANELAAG